MIFLIKFLLFFLIPLVNSNWNSYSPAVCVDIPNNFTLCNNLGYNRMMIPNLFGHDSIAEVHQQLSMWHPLFQLNCNSKTKLFLCSLFTPVCLEQPIYPCRSLCEHVKSSCLPSMSLHGFNWPRMVDCSQYPLDNAMCISAQVEQQSNRKNSLQLKSEQILNEYCKSDWALKVKGTLIVNNLNETAILHVHNFTVIKGEFLHEQKRILPVFVNDLQFWNQLLTGNSKTSDQRLNNDDKLNNDRFNRFNNERINDRFKRNLNLNRSTNKNRIKQIQTFKKYTFILFGSHQLNGEKLTLFFPLTNKLPYLKKLYYKKIRGNKLNCNEQLITQRSRSNLESILYFENQNQLNTSEGI